MTSAPLCLYLCICGFVVLVSFCRLTSRRLHTTCRALTVISMLPCSPLPVRGSEIQSFLSSILARWHVFFFTVCHSLRPATIIKLQTRSRCSWQGEVRINPTLLAISASSPHHLLMVSSVYLRWWSDRPEALNHTHVVACGAGLFSVCSCEPYAAKKNKSKQTDHVPLFLQVTPTCTPAPDPVSLCTKSAIVLINNEGGPCLLLSFF